MTEYPGEVTPWPTGWRALAPGNLSEPQTMRNLLLPPILALSLSSCAAPILMKNPSSGEIAQCYSSGDIVRRYYERDACVEKYEKLGWAKAETDMK